MGLTDNTTSLQSILDAVNALPPAGSGGSDGELIFAEGSVTINTTTASNTVVATVTGLEFTPKHVIVQHAYSGSQTVTYYSTARNRLYAIQSGLIDLTTYMRSNSSSSHYVQTDVNNTAYVLSITEDGFVLQTGTITNGAYFDSRPFTWLAIG